MKFTGVNFSMADRINSAKTETSNKNDISQAPTRQNPSPGDSTVQTPNTSNIDSAGDNIANDQNGAVTKTNSDSADKQLNTATSLQYEKPGEPEFPEEKDPGKTKPIPKKKGFMESLIESQMQDAMSGKQGDRPDSSAKQADYPKGAEDPNKPLPADNTPTRPNPQGFDPGRIGTRDSQAPPGDRMDAPWNNPEVNLGPKYSAPGGPRAINMPQGIKKASGAIPNIPKFKK